MNTVNLNESSGKEIRAIRVMIVDDLEVVRLGLTLGLGNITDMEIVGEASDGPSSVNLGIELAPDVILMDIGLPGFDGVVATKKLKASTQSKILVLSSHCDKQTVLTALQAGADGFCFKDASSEKVATAIRTVYSGGIWLSEGISENVLRSLKIADPEATNEHTSLSTTELKILGFIFEGASIQSIAERLNYSSSEVMLYTNRVLQKIAVNQTRQNKVENKDRRITGEHRFCRTCPKCHEILSIADEECPFDGERTQENELIGTIFADRYDMLSRSVPEAAVLCTRRATDSCRRLWLSRSCTGRIWKILICCGAFARKRPRLACSIIPILSRSRTSVSPRMVNLS
ncbi:MAG: response regulator transcription factor [Cyanobacteria bacterium]|nr:response regulator transcription factor [Cyanobacteriota bacterium]